MRIRRQGYPLPIDHRLFALLERLTDDAGIRDGDAVIVHFRDPDYDPERGGFHPVEIYVTSDGRISYITDFAYVGQGQDRELAKEVDWDFGLGLLQHHGIERPIASGRELWAVWQENFLVYHLHWGVFRVTVERG